MRKLAGIPLEPVEIIIEDERWADAGIAPLATRAVAATLAALGLADSGFSVSLLACDDGRIAALNGGFRGKETATNVLSWPSEERGVATAGEMPVPPDPSDPELGDIALSYDTCRAEAIAANRTLPDHATHLIVHGLLHLLGFDHVREADATVMEGLEVEILGNLGIADPYH